jgi:hypothetical protein
MAFLEIQTVCHIDNAFGQFLTADRGRAKTEVGCCFQNLRIDAHGIASSCLM